MKKKVLRGHTLIAFIGIMRVSHNQVQRKRYCRCVNTISSGVSVNSPQGQRMKLSEKPKSSILDSKGLG